MKRLVKILSLTVACAFAVCALFTGCGKKVNVDNGELIRDMDVAPVLTAAYEQYSTEVYSAYKAVADKHKVDGEVDIDNAEVQKAACSAAAKLYAYACYNERTLDKYVYFGNQDGTTNLGASGYANATRQEYYLRINESEKTCGYRYHYTIKKVTEASGLVSTLQSVFESARTRMTDKTNLLYRFEGDNIRVGARNETLECNILECDWKTGNDWGKADLEIKKGDFIPPEDIRADIEAHAGEDNITIRGNINVLADDIVKYSLINETEDGHIFVVMVIDTAVANKDEASLKMLRKANGSNDCVWSDEVQEGDEDNKLNSGLTIIYRLWKNGMFRHFTVSERWSGKISGFSGTADSVTTTHYSYSDRDCDMTEKLNMLAKAIEEKK